jgi:serine protease inhibitor
MVAYAWVRERQQFVANHPFVFVIENIKLGIVLFVGRLSRV